MATRLFVGNISSGVREDDLKKEFSFYGKVVGVDLKQKRDANDEGNESQFAFVTLDADNLNINRCIQEFSEQKWKGSFLKVTIAKESFLDRLKRERAEAEKPKEETVQPKVIEKINISMPSKFNVSTPSKVNVSTPPVKNSNSFVKDTAKTSHNEKKEKRKTFENDHDEDFSPKRRKKFNDDSYSTEPNTVNEFKQKIQNGSAEKSHDDESPQGKDTTNLSNKKRLESIQNMKNTYNEKKSLIKMALSGIDCKKNNKIVFGDEDNLNETNKRGIGNEKKNNSSDGKQQNKIKSNLFAEESDENDEETYNFEIKKQFEGESGRKLLELQSRYRSDKRFTLDERFLEDNLENNVPEDVEISDKHLDYGNDENYDDVDIVNEEEKIRQAEILKGIIGDTGTVNRSENTKKLPLKTMLRFDPLRSDHDKFLNKPIEKPALSKKAKKEKKKLEQETLNEKQRPDDAPAPIVSEERYYKINEPLKQSSEDNQPFSLLSLFGNRDVDENATSKDEEYSTKPIENSNKVKNPLNGDKNPFFYDSSDSEDESKKKKENEKSKPVDVLKDESKPTTIVENFFFSDTDPRFLEGLEFFLDAKPRSDKTRHELKSIVKKRIKNNLRNSNKFHSKKVARSSKAKFKKR